MRNNYKSPPEGDPNPMDSGSGKTPTTRKTSRKKRKQPKQDDWIILLRLLSRHNHHSWLLKIMILIYLVSNLAYFWFMVWEVNNITSQTKLLII